MSDKIVSMADDYYQTTIIVSFREMPENINYDTERFLRNPECLSKLTLNHLEYIQFHVRLLKPKNFLELGVQLGELAKNIIPLVN
jgi:hypothetical protein